MTDNKPKKDDGVLMKNFKDYLEFIADLGDTFTQEVCLFRGQLCDKPLIPKLGRLGLESIKDFEANVFSDFRKRYIAFSPRSYDTDFDLLALGQHYGLPTRLLDWTENALIALWFATESDIEDTHSVVWVFAPEDENILEEKSGSPFSVRSTKVFCPNHISQRITAQSGWFTCHKLMETNSFFQFETLKKYKDNLLKIRIPKKIFSEVRVKLNIMGINSSTVYPDLVGLSRHLTWKHLKTERF
nr:FRG domain-containing protein [uncultured Flavobacterium sp.]